LSPAMQHCWSGCRARDWEPQFVVVHRYISQEHSRHQEMFIANIKPIAVTIQA